MGNRAADLQAFIGRELHSFLFLEEFVFSKTKFSPIGGTELELADAVVMLGEILMIFQIKQRAAISYMDADTERRWFRSKVLGKATKQVRDTLHYLQTHDQIIVCNERGHSFDIAAARHADIIKVVVYAASPILPLDCLNVRHKISTSAGFIHVLSASDYLQIARTLRVPQEVVLYFKFREKKLIQFSEACKNLPEAALLGQFVVRETDVAPTHNSAAHLSRLVHDPADWNIAPILRRLHDNLSDISVSRDYYRILIEFNKLSRSAWRLVKERIDLCIEKVLSDTFALPSRITIPETGCGFVFVPVPSDLVRRPDWETIRIRGVRQFTEAHKYDQRLGKCVGFSVGKDGDFIDTDWCLLDYPWVEDMEIQEQLDKSFPFRPVREAEVGGYRFVEG